MLTLARAVSFVANAGNKRGIRIGSEVANLARSRRRGYLAQPANLLGLPQCVWAMPMQNITPVEARTAIAAAESDLKWHMAEHNVPEEVQAVIFHAGFRKSRAFVGLGETRQDVKEALKEAFGIDSADGVPQRLAVSNLFSTWDAARTYTQKADEERAEARSATFKRPVDKLDHLATREAFQGVWGKLVDAEVPSRYYLGEKTREIEANDPVAEPLSEVTSIEDGEPELPTVDADTSGSLKIRLKAPKGTLPANPEEMRIKHRLLAHVWLFLRYKHANRDWLRDLAPADFTKLSDYVLGKHVAGLRITTERQGITKEHRPKWAQVLAYEFAMRKDACKRMREEGLTLKAALAMAIKDQEIRGLYFVTPFQLEVGSEGQGRSREGTGGNSGGSQQPQGRRSNRSRTPKGGKGKPASKGKGAEKGNGKRRLRTTTPDGRPICFAYNNEGENCTGSCGMVHACQICGEEGHPRYEHGRQGRT